MHVYNSNKERRAMNLRVGDMFLEKKLEGEHEERECK